jgi:hypothetical protein
MTAENIDGRSNILKLASQYSPELLFVAALVTSSIVPSGSDRSEISLTNRTANSEQLARYLLGADVTGSAIPTAAAVREIIDAASLACSQSLEVRLNERRVDEQVSLLRMNLGLDVEYLRGTAFPEQIVEEIVDVLGPFEVWFDQRLGFRPSELTAVLHAIKNGIEDTIHEQFVCEVDEEPGHVKNENASEVVLDKIASRAGLAVPLQRTDCILSNGLQPTETAWNCLISLIGFKSEDASRGTSLDARRRPLFVLSGDRVLIADLTHSLDCLRQALYELMRTDEVIYSRFQRHRSEWLEEKITEYLRRIFGATNIYKNLVYADPDRTEEGATAELDAAVYWPPFLVLVEAKSKQFRLEGQLGDLGRLRSDLRANVEDAFNQALRAKRHLTRMSAAEFKEKDTGRVLVIKTSEVRQVHLMTVSLRFLGSAVNGLANLRELGLFSRLEFPWLISRADLDTISQVVEGPDIFLHYLQRRRELEEHPTRWIGYELDLYGAYLRRMLAPTSLPKDTNNIICFPDYYVEFYRWMDFKRGLTSIRPDMRLDFPISIRKVLGRLRKLSDKNAHVVALSLLDLADSDLIWWVNS